MEGYVFKWVNFMKGWKPRYIILDEKTSTLLYSKHKTDKNIKKVSLKTARIIDEKKKKYFVIEKDNSKFFLRTNTEEEKKSWILKLTDCIHEEKNLYKNNDNHKGSFVSVMSNLNINTQNLEQIKSAKNQEFSVSMTNSVIIEKNEDINVKANPIEDYYKNKNTNNVKNIDDESNRFSSAYYDYHKEINKYRNIENFSNFDKIINNYQNLKNTFFEFNSVMEGFNLILMSKAQKIKPKEQLSKIYQNLYAVKIEIKERLDLMMGNLIGYKDEIENKYKNAIITETENGTGNQILETDFNHTEEKTRQRNETLYYCAKEEINSDITIEHNARNFVKVAESLPERNNLPVSPENEVINIALGEIISNNPNLEYEEDPDHDSSFEDCISFSEAHNDTNNVNNTENAKNDELINEEFQASIEQSMIHESKLNKNKFRNSLSLNQTDFVNFSYSFKSRLNLPTQIKCSQSMVSDMLKSLTKEKMSLPITYNEPLSMLQRLCEKFQYSQLLYKAAESEIGLKHCYTAGFIIAELSLNIKRILKPFNPILGETFEYFDNKNKYRYFSEQVSHNPPISAFICESEEFAVFGDCRSKSKFKILKRAMEITFTNKTNILFKKTNDHLVYNKPILYLKGLIMGTPHYDFSGIVNIDDPNSKNIQTVLDFFEEGRKSKPLGYFEGRVVDCSITPNKTLYIIGGNWNSHVYVTDKDGNNKFEIWKIDDETVCRNTDLYNNYLISQYACNLNFLPAEEDSNLVHKLPPTDSRFRPDQLALESRKMELAENEKLRIEQKQRERHVEFEKEKIKYEPIYFAEVLDSKTSEYIYIYKGDYWSDRKNNNFSHLHNIFTS